MTTPIAGGKITREAVLAAALEIIGLVHAGVDGEDADQAGQVEETPHRPAAGRGRCWPPPRPVARRTPSQTTTRPSRECTWLNATLSRVPARGTSTSSTNPGPNQPSTIRGQCCGGATDTSGHVRAIVSCAQTMSRRLGWLVAPRQPAH